MSHWPNDADEGRDREFIASLLRDGVAEPRLPSGLTAGEEARLESWRTLLRECRSELQADPAGDALRAERLRRRILAASTREDLSWRAEWGLWRSFLAQRLRASLLLRVVAASLLLHMVALPVMAYYTWVRPEPDTHISFDLPDAHQPLPFAEAEPEPASEPSARDWPLLDSLENSADAAEWLPEHLLAERPLEQVGPRVVLWTDPLGLALLAEVLLEEGDLESESRPSAARLEFVLEELHKSLEALRADPTRPALRRFTASAWLRARSRGLGQADAPFERECAVWLGDSQPLAGAAWLAAYTSADRELAGE